MILGFTGTREGMTDRQREAVAEFLRQSQPTQVHHGDCIGADSQFHDSALLTCEPWIESHPCNLEMYRAHRKANVVHPIKPPKTRNQDIVDASDELLAAPKSTQSEPRSGTWQTIGMALKAKKQVTFVWPDGSVTAQGFTSLAEIFA